MLKRHGYLARKKVLNGQTKRLGVVILSLRKANTAHLPA